MKGLTHLIIGSGPAGIFSAETIRIRDPEASILLVTDDKSPAQSPVMLSYWMAGDLPQTSLFFRDSSWFERRGIEVRTTTRVTSVDTRLKKIKLADGGEIPFDRLLIATGSSPISLPIPGKDSKGVHSLRYQRDAESILQGGNELREIVIIGGGFVGLKLACHLKQRGLRVIVLEKEPKLAARMFDIKASRMVGKKLKEAGVRVETDVEVVQILNQSGWVSGVGMKDGRVFSCQRVVEAVGVRPNVRFLSGSGIDVKGGILVDRRMETNVLSIFAAGDVAMTKDSITSGWVNNATWPAATRQGAVAGSNMAGGNRLYTHNFSLNAINLFGLQVMSAGHPYHEKEPGVDCVIDEEGGAFRKMLVREGRLIGFLLVGDISGAGSLSSLMKRQVELSVDQWDHLLSSRTLQYDLPPHLGFDHGSVFGER
jgi:nitrite reductase (NADH) large subunit